MKKKPDATRAPDRREQRLRWLIERAEAIRQATESRAAILLSAAALLSGGIVFLTNQVLSTESAGAVPVSGLLIRGLLVAASISVCSSAILATSVIVNIFSHSRRMLGKDLPNREFLHAFDARIKYPTFGAFQRGFNVTTDEQFVDAALSHLWSTQHLYMKRYLSLRNAIRMILLAMIFFLGAVAVVLL